jgi:hydroxylamine dehydrogenase
MESVKFKQVVIAVLGFILLGAFVVVGYVESMRRIPDAKPHIVVSKDNEKCIDCHEQQSNARTVAEQWRASTHAKRGVGCLECHSAESSDADAFDHYEQTIATVVTPGDCAQCHPGEFDQFQRSHHAQAGKILGSLDNVLAEVVEGHMPVVHGKRLESPAAVSGCKQCHGSAVKPLLDADGNKTYRDSGVLVLDPDTWPNTGIGRLNPDGSLGSCAACHNRHYFSAAQAREPDDCGKCHLGPDHPQYEIYRESKHGINYIAHKDEMNLDAHPWIVGEDYVAAATCATCHMSATPNQPVTHDVGERISWTLRPPISEKVDAVALKQGKQVMPWQERRSNMKDVCVQCHSQQYVESFYTQYDDLVGLYNYKFGEPATDLMKGLKTNGLITADIAFDDKIEWTYFYLWHHEGRRARMGASMMGPDYTQWHGMFEVADRFYMEFLPEVREAIDHGRDSGNASGAAASEAMLDEIMARDEHLWIQGKLSAEDKAARDAAAEEFRKRYAGSD